MGWPEVCVELEGYWTNIWSKQGVSISWNCEGQVIWVAWGRGTGLLTRVTTQSCFGGCIMCILVILKVSEGRAVVENMREGKGNLARS